jgi:hypothetical protein
MTETTLKKALDIKEKIKDCKEFCDDLMRIRKDKGLFLRVEGVDDNAELEPSELFINDLIGITGNEMNRLQKKFNELT